MYIIEHALLNLGKNKGRNILLGIIILAIITATVVALAIYNTTGVVIEETKTALLCAVRLAPRMQTQSGGARIAGNNQGEAAVSLEQYLSFADSDYLDGADIKESSRNADGVDAVYYLKKPDMIAAYEAELRTKGLPDGYAVRADESALDRMVGPVESLKDLSLTFLLIVLVLGAIIMVLLSVIAIRERKYEIGVLRAMGMKKKKVSLGLWTEIIIITCVCFALGLGIGTALSQPVSNAIMSGQAQTPASKSSTLADRLNDLGETQTETIDVSVNTATVLEIFGISILLASVAGIVSVSRITKYEPIKILMERN